MTDSGHDPASAPPNDTPDHVRAAETTDHEATDHEAIGQRATAGGATSDVVRTGHPTADAAVEALASAADLPLTDQIAEYEAAHRTLQETLQSIDEP
jgi:hypothetical protein